MRTQARETAHVHITNARLAKNHSSIPLALLIYFQLLAAVSLFLSAWTICLVVIDGAL